MGMMYRLTSRRDRRRRKAFRIWNLFVMIVGYAAILYELISWTIYFYLQFTGKI